MKIASGTDIIEIARIKQSIEEMGEKFLQRVFTEKEIAYCESKKAQKYQHYTARFAAKEAGFKAISCLLDDKYSVSWLDIEVENDSQGRPILNVSNVQGLERLESIDVSLSHCREYAVANVTMLYKDY
jgi:holo-[acyl-carrier protein] synthase